MRFDILRHAALALGMTACSVASAQMGAYAPNQPYNQQYGVQQNSPYQNTPYGQVNQPLQAYPNSVYQQPAPTGVTTNGDAAAYTPPAEWNRFNPQAYTGNTSNVFRPASTDQLIVDSAQTPMLAPAAPAPQTPIPAPAGTVHHAPSGPVHYSPAPQSVTHAPIQHSHVPGGNCESCNQGSTYSTPFSNAVSAPWSGNSGAVCGQEAVFVPQASSIGPISPWFAGGNVVFYSLHQGGDRVLVTNNAAMPQIYRSDVDPDPTVGFDVHGGRYLGCGNYGLGFRYMNFNPARAMTQVVGAEGDYRVTIPTLRDVSINFAAAVGNVPIGAYTVYDLIDTYGAAIRVRRDVSIQGLEISLFSFGLMGARRMGHCGPRLGANLMGNMGGGYGACGPNACGPNACGPNACGPIACGPQACGPGYGGMAARPRTGFFGGAGGPLARPCSGRVQVVTSHGFRWFQFKDYFQLAASINNVGGYQPVADFLYAVDVENNLYGYQFGSMLSYCVGRRLLLNTGAKFGIYGNDANVRQNMAAGPYPAYINGDPAATIITDMSDTVLAGLGEFDLGLGYRVNCRLTVRGGYRFLAACGVATSTDQIPTEFTSVASATGVRADDCLILHGAYVGADYNW